MAESQPWKGTAAMTALDGWLYIIQNGKLWRADPRSGAYKQLGIEEWHETAAMTALGKLLFVIQKGKLWSADPETGKPTQLGEGQHWNETAAMTAWGRWLYVIQNGMLWRADPGTGKYEQLGEGQHWNDTAAMTAMQAWGSAALYVVQNGKLWRADPADGHFMQLGWEVDWQNWSGNIVHTPVTGDYYYMPHNMEELRLVLAGAAQDQDEVTIRVSGQRHSQPPLVINDNRSGSPATRKTWLVDMSCYADLGPNFDQRIVLGPEKNQVTVNAGVREDELDAFLTANNLMLKTVTAGGFFSLGGMTVVDVHGGTIDAPIFAETVSAFTIVRGSGEIITIDANSGPVGKWSQLQFARVSLGGLGIVTSVTIDVLPRPFATTLQGGTEELQLPNKHDFVTEFLKLVTHDRLEVFFTPYATGRPLVKNFLVLWWNVKLDSGPGNTKPRVDDACQLAKKQQYGAPILGGIGKDGAEFAQKAQYFDWAITGAAEVAAATLIEIESDVDKANKSHSDLWLAGAVRVIFMSYYISLPNLDKAGLEKVWDGLDVVSRIVNTNGNFHIAAPMEFRFVKGGNSAMSGAYTVNTANTWFVNLDLIGFVEENKTPSQYPAKLLQFFADVERQWVAMGGFPHQGKMYGFYDPDQPTGTHTAPFNVNFLADLRRRRDDRLKAFNEYRKSMDPGGRFYNDYLRAVLGDTN